MFFYLEGFEGGAGENDKHEVNKTRFSWSIRTNVWLVLG